MGAAKMRTDGSGRALRGSQRHMQACVNGERPAFESRLREAIPALRTALEFEWFSPLAEDGYKEFRDRGTLAALGLEQLYPKLRAFWPSRGPVWDALGRVSDKDGRSTALLLEAKSHLREYRSACNATSHDSRDRIAKALDQLGQQLGADDAWGDASFHEYYQTANRLAFADFLRKSGADVLLINVCFADDECWPRAKRAALDDWSSFHERLKRDMGLASVGWPAIAKTIVVAPLGGCAGGRV